MPLSANDGQYKQEEMGGYQILINYRGGLEKFRHISLTEVLANRIPENLLSDRLVFIGAIAPSLNDNFATPYNSALHTPTEFMPGVVINANLTSQIIRSARENRPMLRAVAKPLNWLWILFWSGYTTTLGAVFIKKSWLTVTGILLAAGIIVTISYGAFILGWLMPIFTPLLTVASAAILSIGLVLWQNLMLSYRKLADYARSLEDKVQERTAELAQANQEISTLNQKLQQENLRLGAELDVARQLQQMVLPKPEELKVIKILRMNSEKNLTLAIINYSEGKVSISGQHEAILVVRAGGQIEFIDTMDLGLPIGIDDDIDDFIDQTTVALQAGDGLVLYTDGITEAFNLAKKQYGMER